MAAAVQLGRVEGVEALQHPPRVPQLAHLWRANGWGTLLLTAGGPDLPPHGREKEMCCTHFKNNRAFASLVNVSVGQSSPRATSGQPLHWEPKKL